ncbi:uncharacterized protein LOC114179487 [Vigna unguiculata]|uniref:uncharacterized protein LOC114179487 n=1 Tax=Vigna unguiculata TaxID=3917 RepID=UPI001015FD75|nr:uncharacterized protein LOC114179487 [Vigna unguiculata]
MYTKKLFDKLPFVACVVKEYKGNGLGDLFLTVKDSKHTIQANVHNKAVSHAKCGLLIGIGVVILLKQVFVFNSKADKLYLNITLRNIVKFFNHDISDPTMEEVAASHKG